MKFKGGQSFYTLGNLQIRLVYLGYDTKNVSSFISSFDLILIQFNFTLLLTHAQATAGVSMPRFVSRNRRNDKIP